MFKRLLALVHISDRRYPSDEVSATYTVAIQNLSGTMIWLKYNRYL